ncbi:MAG: aminotransferase class V-fold PLP-dependent enzyme [Coriobacteriia bacterium]|nr:aminotransferase class V-fold PLP-dependent enzyme [Coriobacteriia bacterium]
MIYLDNAATTLQKPPAVIDAVVSALHNSANASRGAYGEALASSRLIFKTRQKLAEFFGCETDHVVFTSNATESLNIAIQGLFSSGDHIISTDWEHNSVLRPLYRLQREQGVELDFVSADENGALDLASLESLIKDNTKAIVCTHASNVIGDCIDLDVISKFAKAHGLLFILDASQTAGVIPINMEELGISVLCASAHKGLLGPQGVGVLCIAQGVEIRPLKVGGTGIHSFDKNQPQEYPTRLEAGTLNGHGIAGLSAALDFLNETGLSTIHEHEMKLATRFYKGIKQFDSIKIYGDHSKSLRTAVVALNVGSEDASYVSDLLSNEFGIATRPGAHCAPRIHEAMKTQAQGAVRFSFGWYNSTEDVDAAIDALGEITRYLCKDQL